jgi:hypothetical protein
MSYIVLWIDFSREKPYIWLDNICFSTRSAAIRGKEQEMDEIVDIIRDVSKENIKNHIKNLEGTRHPIFAPEALEQAKSYVWDDLASFGHDMSVHQFDDDGSQFENVIGMQKGTQQPEKKIIVLAHFDTVSTSPGANDNASGIAVMLELARVFRKLKFKKSILFVGVNLEEQRVEGQKGSPICRGSRALANHAKESGWQIEGVVNFEEIAFAGDDVAQKSLENLPIEIPEKGNFIAVVGNERSAGMVQGYIQGIEQYKIPLPYLPLVVPGNGEMLPDSRRSDHSPFWDNEFEAIMITDTANFRTPHYHKPSDTIGTLNLDFATAVCCAGGVLVFEMAGIDKS